MTEKYDSEAVNTARDYYNSTDADNFYGRACRTGDGKWETIYRLIPGAKLSDGQSELKTEQKL